MPNKKRTIFTKILIWRYKYISERQFILVLSVLVGFLAGLGTVLLKYLTLFIQSVLEGGFIRNYPRWWWHRTNCRPGATLC